MNFRINSIENRYQHRFFFSFLFMKQSVFKHGPKINRQGPCSGTFLYILALKNIPVSLLSSPFH